SSLEEEQPTTLSIVYYLQIYHKKLQEQYSPMGSLGMPTFFSSLSGYFHESYHSKLKRTSSYSYGLIGKAFFLLILLSFLIFNTFFIPFSNYFFFESCDTLDLVSNFVFIEKIKTLQFCAVFWSRVLCKFANLLAASNEKFD